MLFALGVIVGISLGFHVGFYFRWLVNSVNIILKRDPDMKPQVVNVKKPDEYDVLDTGAVITPISPYEIERRERAQADQSNG